MAIRVVILAGICRLDAMVNRRFPRGIIAFLTFFDAILPGHGQGTSVAEAMAFLSITEIGSGIGQQKQG